MYYYVCQALQALSLCEMRRCCKNVRIMEDVLALPLLGLAQGGH
jgi:hypothetical protein